jgi:Na+/melibiose symporter-like transporter
LRAGACFGWWNFVAKANLALAAGLALPLLAWLGYEPGAQDADALRALAAVYAFVPVLLKLGACALAWQWRGALEVAAPAAAAQPISLYDSRGGEHS